MAKATNVFAQVSEKSNLFLYNFNVFPQVSAKSNFVPLYLQCVRTGLFPCFFNLASTCSQHECLSRICLKESLCYNLFQLLDASIYPDTCRYSI